MSLHYLVKYQSSQIVMLKTSVKQAATQDSATQSSCWKKFLSHFSVI